MAAEDFQGLDLAFTNDLVRRQSGDLDLISGIANLKAAVIRRVITTPGSIINRPNYGVGLKNFVNSLDGLSKQQQLVNLMKEQLEQDPRVEKLTGVRIDNFSAPGKVLIFIRVKPVGYSEQVITHSEVIDGT